MSSTSIERDMLNRSINYGRLSQLSFLSTNLLAPDRSSKSRRVAFTDLKSQD